MPYCQTCGGEVNSKMSGCPKCGTDLRGATKPFSKRINERGDIIGPLSAGVILILLAITYIRYPINLSIIINYLQTIATQKTYIKPPSILSDSVIFFVFTMGIWKFILSGLRIVLQSKIRKAAEDFIGGVFILVFVFLITNYAADIYTGRTTLAYTIIAFGFLVISNLIIHFLTQER